MTVVDRLHVRLADPSGIALPAAVIVLFIVTALGTAALAVSVSSSSSSRRDSYRKDALEAAEAGLRVARYRTTMLSPGSTYCVGNGIESPAEGYCKLSGQVLGNHAEYTYWTTPALQVGEKCVGEEVGNSKTLSQRCITATGTVAGVTRRVQERVATYVARPLFEVQGLIGFEEVKILNNGKIEGAVASNGAICDSNGVTVENTYYSLTGKSGSCGGSEGTVTKLQTTFVPPSVPIGNSATGAKNALKTECESPPGYNCDYRITNGINKTKKEEDPASGVTFTSSKRSLSMGNGSSLELGGGIYNFCDFRVPGNNATLKIALGAKVAIFIDSAKREGSGCQSDPEAGKLVMKNGLAIENPNKSATNLQFYVYDGSGGTIEFKNNSSSAFYGTIVAPESKLVIGNNGFFTGAIEAAKIEMTQNFKFKWAPEAAELKTEASPRFYRTAWEECVPATTVVATGC